LTILKLSKHPSPYNHRNLRTTVNKQVILHNRIFSCHYFNDYIQYAHVLINYLDKISKCLDPLLHKETYKTVIHFITNFTAQPYCTEQHELPFTKRQAVEKKFSKHESFGVIWLSYLLRALAIHVLTKPVLTFRP